MAKVDCIFCQRNRSRAKEHIFSKYMMSYLGLLDSSLGYSAFGSSEVGFSGGNINLNSLDRSHTFNNFLAGRVCDDCNNNWMNALEIEVRKFKFPLIKGESTIRGLSEEEKVLLGKWAIKTVVALQSCFNFSQFVLPDHIGHDLYLNRENSGFLPEEVAVFGFVKSDREEVRWARSMTHIISCNSKEQATSYYNELAKWFFQIKNLFLAVVYNPFPELTCSYYPDLHDLLYSGVPIKEGSVESRFNSGDFTNDFLTNFQFSL